MRQAPCLGRFIASLTQVTGWGIVAIPAGIVTAEMTARRLTLRDTTRSCPDRLTEGHDAEAQFCRHRGKPLPEYQQN